MKNKTDVGKKANSGNDKQASPPTAKAYNISLKTAEDVRRMLSVTLNDLRRGLVDVQIARALIYGGQVLLGVFEQCGIVDRIKKLEELAQYGGGKQ